MTPADTPVSPVSLHLEASDRNAFDAALRASFERWGFAVLSDHGASAVDIKDALDATRAFFALPEATKRSFHIKDGGGQRGYTGLRVETAKGFKAPDFKEFWHIGRDLPEGHPYTPYMPSNIDVPMIKNWHAHTYALFEMLDAAGQRVLRAIARGLGLPEGFWDNAVREGNSILRLLHYPPVITTDGSVRAGAHGDINVITLLLGAEEAGLEVMDRDGQWVAFTPPEGALVINIGDMLARQTNHVLPSTTHRVVNPTAERAEYSRYATPFFLHFAPDYLVETLPQCITPDRPNLYPDPITANDFLLERLRDINLT